MKNLYQLLECPIPANTDKLQIYQFNDLIVKELAFSCPLIDFHFECPFLFLHQMPFRERTNYIENLSNKEKTKLVDEHQKCLTIEEKDVFGKIFI